MAPNTYQISDIIEFREFRVEVGNHRLFRDGQPVSIKPKVFSLLVHFARHPDQVVTHDDLRTVCWPDTHIEKGTVTRHISYLRTALDDADERIIKTVPKLGYRFVAPVSAPASPVWIPAAEQIGQIVNQRSSLRLSSQVITKRWPRLAATAVAGAFLCVLFIAGNATDSQKGSRVSAMEKIPTSSREPEAIIEETEVRRVLKESQVYESLVLYRAPDKFDPAELSKYFVPVAAGGRSARSIEASIKRQLERGYRYGPEARLEAFDFLHVRMVTPDYAEVRTRERWYLPVVREDGSRVIERNPFLGPYDVAYTLRKVQGRWLVQSATTPYSE